jgi:hypothetical protein
MTFGSCFAYNISAYLAEYRFRVSANPFGVLYNPYSIYSAVKLLKENRRFTKDDLIFNQGEWHSFYHHSDFSHHDAVACLQKINSKLEETVDFIGNTDIVILTYGTSYVYKYLKKDIVVSNCHKLAADEFDRYRLSIEECRSAMKNTVDRLRDINQNIKIVFTVSPVRHWKDGAVENQRSKAILLLSVEKMVKDYSENCFYFPSYEIIMDDLRDYRFYERDLLHPNKLATDYVWDKFSSAYFRDGCKNSMAEVDKLNKARFHRVRNPQSTEAQNFFKAQLTKIEQLMVKYPFLDLADDYDYFKNLADRD